MITFAHRGAARNRREENTLAAFEVALAAGASLESDARIARDGQVVLAHDSIVRRGLRWCRIRACTAGELARFGVPTIDAFYDRLGTDFELSVDLKVAAAGEPLIAAADRRGATDRLWLVSDDIEVLARLRANNRRVHLVHEARPAAIRDRAAHAAALAGAAIDAQNADVKHWTVEAVAASHERDVLAFGSLANDADQFARALELGLDALYTDRLELARMAP